MSSIGGRIGLRSCSAYYATKFAVEGLSESLRYELKAHGVRVKADRAGAFQDRVHRPFARAMGGAPDYEPQVSNMKAWVAQADATRARCRAGGRDDLQSRDRSVGPAALSREGRADAWRFTRCCPTGVARLLAPG